jgi:hypothetical protein
MPTLERYLRRRRQTGQVALRPSPGRAPSIYATIEERRTLWRQLEENGEATLERHCELWEKRRGEGLGLHHEQGRAQAGLDLRRWEPPSEANRREVLGESARDSST